MIMLVALLLASGQPTAAPPARASSDPDQRVKCRKIPVTGTLAGFTRECRTIAEWRKQEDAASETSRQMQDKGLVRTCGATEPGIC